ncbi:hypothetical protein EW146_g7916 [Bondarzewia mesenterica]|uniref:Uncharacterized protein n=1 Tax=Bondarzewia mesenterica TaxID=1095465 RepID=A0A4S4LIF9_9AGAM|nr:hypothetical protein EW146_g7916 [Bondarzewia mesenterica]
MQGRRRRMRERVSYLWAVKLSTTTLTNKPKFPNLKKNKKPSNANSGETSMLNSPEIPNCAPSLNPPSLNSASSSSHAVLARLSASRNDMEYKPPANQQPFSKARFRDSLLDNTTPTSRRLREPQAFPGARLSPLQEHGQGEERSKEKGKQKGAPFPMSLSPPTSCSSVPFHNSRTPPSLPSRL